MNYLLSFDNKIFLWLNHWAGQSGLADALIKFLAHDLPYVVVVGFIVFWFWQVGWRRVLVEGALSGFLARGVLVEVVREVLPRSRPFEVFTVVQLITKGVEKSFPSGHASALFALAFSVYFYSPKWGRWLGLVFFVSVLARVVAGVHYLSDILAGMVLGWLSAWIVKQYATQLVDGILSVWDKLNFWKK